MAGFVADAPTDIQDSVALMVSELATNALVHAASGFEVAVDCSDFALLVAVNDRGDGGMPHLRAPASDEPYGRGLRIVDALSEEWGVDRSWDEGKTVWFRVLLRPPENGISDNGYLGGPSDLRVDLTGQSPSSTRASSEIDGAPPDARKNRVQAPKDERIDRNSLSADSWMVGSAPGKPL